jgi:hypothetical protein
MNDFGIVGLSLSWRIIANAIFEIGFMFYPDVGQFLADPIST